MTRELLTGNVMMKWKAFDRRQGTDAARLFLDWVTELTGESQNQIASAWMDHSTLCVQIYETPTRLNDAGDGIASHIGRFPDTRPPSWPDAWLFD